METLQQNIYCLLLKAYSQALMSRRTGGISFKKENLYALSRRECVCDCRTSYSSANNQNLHFAMIKTDDGFYTKFIIVQNKVDVGL